jgi:hypothetical protein
MDEKEYFEFLQAVATEHIRLERLRQLYPDAAAQLQQQLDELASLARLTKAVADREKNEPLQRALAVELQQQHAWEAVPRAFDETGLTEALNQHGEALLRGFRRSLVPEADLDILRQAGIDHPEAVLRLAEERAQVFARRVATREFSASQVLQSAEMELRQAASQLAMPTPAPIRKPRKWFKGLTRILAGGASAIGNVLLGIGAIPTAIPVGGAAVLSSCTGALVLIGDGIEMLRGNE